MENIRLEDCPAEFQEAVRGFNMNSQKIVCFEDTKFRYHCAYYPLSLYGRGGATASSTFCILQNVCLSHGPCAVEVALLTEDKPPQQIAGIPLLGAEEVQPVFDHLLGDYQVVPYDTPKADFKLLRDKYGEECRSFNGQLWVPLKPELFGLSIEVWRGVVVDEIDEEILETVDADVRKAMGFDESTKFNKRIESYDQVSWIIYTFVDEKEK